MGSFECKCSKCDTKTFIKDHWYCMLCDQFFCEDCLDTLIECIECNDTFCECCTDFDSMYHCDKCEGVLCDKCEIDVCSKCKIKVNC
jgi:hypothetical protein